MAGVDDQAAATTAVREWVNEYGARISEGWSKEQRRFYRPGPLRRLRYRLAVWLLKPHWLPLLENYNRNAEDNPHGESGAERCAYIAIGIKYAIGVTRWGRYK